LDPIKVAVAASGYEPGQIYERTEPRVQPVSQTDAAGRDDYEWDLVIIGSGSAAFAAAIKATATGASVLMVERGTPGGTCVNIGCVPSKALLRAVETFHSAGHHPFAGVPHLSGRVDLAALVQQKNALVDTLRQAKYLDLVDHYGFELRTGLASFIEPHTIAINGQPATAAKVLIATGADPAIPPIAGLAEMDYLTSTTALNLTEIPGSVAVIGANAIGLELGQLFSQLGSEVTFLDIAERIAPFEEPEISAALTQMLTQEGAVVITNAHITQVTTSGNRYTLTGDLGDLSELSVDHILVATGRTPNTAQLNLQAAGINTDERGFIQTDEHLATSASHIYAAGDVIASPQFVYVAAYEGALAATNMFSPTPSSVDYATMPRVTFTSPQIASVGLTEAQARQRHSVKTAILPMSYVPRAIVNQSTGGLLKLVADSETDELLGAHMIGDNAGEVIQAAVYALLNHMTTKAIADNFHAYLTMAEALKLAAQAFDKDISTLSCCAA